MSKATAEALVLLEELVRANDHVTVKMVFGRPEVTVFRADGSHSHYNAPELLGAVQRAARGEGLKE